MKKIIILVIFNPKAGSKSERFNFSDFDSYKNDFDFIFETTKYPNHAYELALFYLKKKVENFMAVGGDGTLNEVARALVNQPANLFLIPTGSGNGLARHVGISMDVKKVLSALRKPNIVSIDVGRANQKYFFTTCGLGFDGYVAYLFSKKSHSRGIFNYLKIIFFSYFNFPAQKMKINGESLNVFSLTFVNANQFGHGAYIAPKASLTDGQLDMVLVRPHSLWGGVVLVYQLLKRTIHHSKNVKYFRCTRFEIQNSGLSHLHLDGEPVGQPGSLVVEIIPKALNIHVESEQI